MPTFLTSLNRYGRFASFVFAEAADSFRRFARSLSRVVPTRFIVVSLVKMQVIAVKETFRVQNGAPCTLRPIVLELSS